MVYDSNLYLPMFQMKVNAQFILDFFTSQGWTKNAICGMLGNMQSESTINFGIYESLDSDSSTNGFGLVQWTPNTKYFDWANANGYGSDHINGELNRIIYEKANNVQWVVNRFGYSSMTFDEFTKSTDTPENLAYVWLYNYEAPANLDQPQRKTQARNWYDALTGGNGGTVTPKKQDALFHLLLSDALHGWK